MAQLKDSVVQGSLRVTDTLYTTNLNLSSASASLSIFTDANKNLVTKSAADAWSALGGGASGKHADSYFIKAITSTDEVMVRFNGTDGSVQNSRMSMNDNGLITVSYNGRYPGDTQFKNAAGTIVGERWLDQGDGTNVTSPRFYWRVWRPKATADTGVNTQYEQFRLPPASSGTAANATYEILTSKSKVTVAQGGTGAGTFTSGEVLIGNGTSAITTRSIVNNTSVGALGWDGAAADAANTYLVNRNTIAYWNGAYKGTTSNLAYCNKGAFGDMATKTASDYIAKSIGTTKGDIIYWSAASTPARLGIGTANHILIATADGPRWTVSASLASATSTTANTDAWDTLTLGNNVNRTSTSAHSSGKIVLYGTAAAGTTITHGSWSGSGLTVGGTVKGQANAAFIASGQSDPYTYIRFDTRAGTSAFSPTTTVTYTTTTANNWAYIYCQIPTIKHTYATAGDPNSTVTNDYTSYPTRFFFRQYSYTAAAAVMVGKYEDYRLPAVNADRTGNATYEIITTKNLSNITSVNGATFAGTAAASYIATFSGTTDATSSTGAAIINGGLLVKKKLYVTTAATLASTLSVTGAATLSSTLTVAGATTLNGKFVGSANNYGTTLPSSPTAGQIFFQTTDITTFVKNSGDTLTGELVFTSANAIRLSCVSNHSVILRTDDTSFWLLLSESRTPGNNWITPAAGHPLRIDYSTGYSYFSRAYGAVWNDYAEFRRDNIQEKDKQKPGHCVYELGDGTLALTTKRLQYGCEIISDTYGFAIGQDKKNGYDTPIASSGRVLAYPYEEIEEFNKHIGKPVCSGPNGTVSIMSEEEECKYPSCIIGTISEIPSYEEWGSAKVKVDGRVWIRVR